MAKGRKTGGRNFAKGNPGGPGRPKFPPEIRIMRDGIAPEHELPDLPFDIRQLNLDTNELRAKARRHYAECFEQMKDWSLQDLTEFVKRKDARVIELITARLLMRTMSQGKPQDVQATHGLMCGPEAKQVELSGPGGEPLHPLSKVPSEDLIAAYQEVQRQIKERDQCNLTPKPQPLSVLQVQSSQRESDTELSERKSDDLKATFTN